MKTFEEEMAEQERLRQYFNLGWWYGTNCKKCCGVYPKAMKKDGYDPNDFYYECQICGRRTKPYMMPWIAREAWNRDEVVDNIQLRLF